MIYTKTTKKLKELYHLLKKSKKLCLEDTSSTKESCYVEYYSKLIKLIELNIKVLKQNNELTKRREQTLKEHLKKAKKHLEFYQRRVKE